MALLRKQPLFDWRSYAQGRLATGREILLLQKATGQGIRYVELEEKSVRSIGPLPLCEWTATGRSWHRCFCRQPGKSHEAGVYAPFPFRVTGRHRHPIKGNGRDAARFRMSCSASSQILERVTFSVAALNIQFRGSCYVLRACVSSKADAEPAALRGDAGTLSDQPALCAVSAHPFPSGCCGFPQRCR